MSPREQSVTSSSNLPLAILPAFNTDQLALIFGTCLADSAFVVDCETAKVVAANEELLRLLSLGLESLEEKDCRFDRLVHPEDRSIFRTWLQGDLLEAQTTFGVRLLNAHGETIAVDIAVKSIRWQSREYRLGFIRECTEQLRRERALKQRIEVEKSRAMQTLKNSLRVYELNEKIKSTLELTTKLLNVENEKQLFEEAERVLTNENGLNYRNATFLVLQGSELLVACSTRQSEGKAFSLGENNKYSRWIRRGGGVLGFEEKPGELLVPLRSRDSLLGVVEVTQHQREKAFFDECEIVNEWQKDMLLQIGDIIALILDNLRLKRELKRQTTVDGLTGAFNRHHFMKILAAEVHRSHRYSRPLSLLFLDVDNFKAINDRYGHLQGDGVLREVGSLLRQNLREVDVLCRYGGDEFLLLLPETDSQDALEAAEKLVAAAREHHYPNLDDPRQRVPVTISAGVSTLQPQQNEEHLLQVADTALYDAKRAGRDRTAAGN